MARPADVIDLGVRAEALGYHSVWVNTPVADRSATMVGTAAQLLEIVAEYQQTGVSVVALSTSTADVDRIRRLQDQFAAHVIPHATS